MLGADGNEIRAGCRQGESIVLRVGVYFESAARSVIYGFTIKTIDGASVFGTNSELKRTSVPNKKGKEYAIVEFVFAAHLLPGEYFISLGVVQQEKSGPEIVLDRRYDLIHLKINEEQRDAYGVAVVDMVISERTLQLEQRSTC